MQVGKQKNERYYSPDIQTINTKSENKRYKSLYFFPKIILPIQK